MCETSRVLLAVICLAHAGWLSPLLIRTIIGYMKNSSLALLLLFDSAGDMCAGCSAAAAAAAATARCTGQVRAACCRPPSTTSALISITRSPRCVGSVSCSPFGW